MGSDAQLCITRRSRKISLICALLCSGAAAFGQQPPASDSSQIQHLQQLYAARQWSQILADTPPGPNAPAEANYYRGMAFAKLERWNEAAASFEAGHAKAPQDKRFLTELAGVAYRRDDRSTSRKYLQRALKLDPSDRYSQEFLATIFWLDDNLEAAVKHWNAVDQPKLNYVRFLPPPSQIKLKPAILGRAVTFSPFEILKWRDIETTQARLASLGVFTHSDIQLIPAKDQTFTAQVRVNELNGWGDDLVSKLVNLFWDVPNLSVTPEYYNIAHSAVNFASLYRWDPNKRRVYASLSSPITNEPRLRLQLHMDGRDENWDFSRTRPDAPLPASMKLRWFEAGIDVHNQVSGRTSWNFGATVASRTYARFYPSPGGDASLFASGTSLEYKAGAKYRAVSIPERRVTMDVSGLVSAGRVFNLSTFGRLEGKYDLEWYPQARGDDYKTSLSFHAARLFGSVPVDEMYQLGVGQDATLQLRGDTDTKSGKKGSAAIGDQYLLWNAQMEKLFLEKGIVNLKVGPLLDIARVWDRTGFVAPEVWLIDLGLRCKVSFFGKFSIELSVGRDVRTGNHAFTLLSDHRS
jgi:tetratricopeptide (TPR) repeat protein